MDSSDDAIISKSLGGIITSWNKSAERLFGYTAEEVIGQPITILIPPDRLEEEPEIISRLKRGERVHRFETVRRRKDGSLIDISLTISPVRDGSGNIIGASKVARDITESKRMMGELQRANAVLEQFAYSASHDLQEPLRTVKIYGQILEQKHGDQLDPEGVSALRFLQDGATRMETLLRDLLAYTRITKFERPSEKIDANLAFECALQTLGGSISESNAKVECLGSLPPLRIHFAHLQQLFQNLIGNAISTASRGYHQSCWSVRNAAPHIGKFRYRTTGSASHRSTQRPFSLCSSASMAKRNIRALVWAWRYVNALSSSTMAAYGLNPRCLRDLSSDSQFRTACLKIGWLVRCHSPLRT